MMTDFDYAGWAAQPPDMAAALKAAVAEQKRREAAPLIEEAKEAQIDELVDAGVVEVADTPQADDAPVEPGACEEWLATIPEWVDPGTDHGKMYRRGALVRRGGRIWQSEVAGLNSWEPGEDGVHYFIWRDVTHELTPTAVEEPGGDATDTDNDGDGDGGGGGTTPVEAPPFRQPTGAHDAYPKGARVSWQGEVWESLIDANVWAPDAYPQGWRKVTP